MKLRPLGLTTAGRVAPELERRLAALVATMPESLTVDREGLPVVCIDGSDPGWTDFAERILTTGGRAVVVSEPSCDTDPDLVEELVEKLGDAAWRVWIDSPWAAHPALRTSGEMVPSNGEHVTSRLVAPSADRTMLFAQVHALSALGIELGACRWLQRGNGGYGVLALTGDGESKVLLRGISSRAVDPSLSVMLRSETVERHLSLPDPTASWPALLTTVDERGALEAPSVYETTSRSLWRSVATMITDSGCGSLGCGPKHSPLDGLRRALHTFARLGAEGWM